jgi:hypothetical protein
MVLRWLGPGWKGRPAMEGGDAQLEESKPEVRYCAVCEEALPQDGKWWLTAPDGEVIEVCAACFDTRPPNYVARD